MRAADTFRKFETCITKLPKAKQVKTDSYNKGTLYPIISQEEKLISGYCDDESMLFGIEKPVVIFGDHTRVLKYVDFDFIVGADGVKILSPIEDIDAKFLFYYLTWYNIPNLGYSRHYKLLKKIDVPIPKKETQYSIVKELDQINALIEIKEKQLREFEELEQTIFHEMFGDIIENNKNWKIDNLTKFCEVTSSKRIFANEYVSCGVPFYRGKEITELSKGHSVSLELFISENRYENIKRMYGCPNPGDILITAVGTIGNIWVVDAEEPFYFKDGNIIWLKGICGINSIYMRYVLDILINEFKYQMAHGCAYSALTIKAMSEMSIAIPPESMQNEFAERITAISKDKELVKKSLNDLQELLASRMQYWFD